MNEHGITWLIGYAETSRDAHFAHYYLKETTLDHAEAKHTKMSMDNFSALRKKKKDAFIIILERDWNK